jgi:primosomal protein N' (replication factor Y)
MTYHKHPEGLSCHYCGASRPVPLKCPSCSIQALKPVGSGTQKIEKIISELFPHAKVARLDRDTTKKRSSETILEQLEKRELDILVGTQMVTKGHDFPHVTLVGVLQSDVGLNMPDFRAAERTFQLLTQVAGRAGRKAKSGKAYIQTYNPDHPAICFAKDHNYAGFAASELKARKELGYPPFGRLMAIRFNSTDPLKAEQTARNVAVALSEAVQRLNTNSITVLGPAPSPLSFLQNRYRWQILVKAKNIKLLRMTAKQIASTTHNPQKEVRIKIDIDPVSML